jgi:hypothetical protein
MACWFFPCACQSVISERSECFILDGDCILEDVVVNRYVPC